MVGAAGAIVSIVTFITAEAALVTPDTVSVAVKRCTPSGKAAVTKLQAPLALAVAVPSSVARRRHSPCCLRPPCRSASGRRIGNAVADNARVRRERGDGRDGRRLGVRGLTRISCQVGGRHCKGCGGCQETAGFQETPGTVRRGRSCS